MVILNVSKGEKANVQKKSPEIGQKMQMKKEFLLFGLSLNFSPYTKSVLVKNQASVVRHSRQRNWPMV
ncbi:MAG: hypothetical protein J7M25_04340 [Deltaproteobacteria bacterium]|nr:hypothetical protein [Deltaproteobacteria bacterium]